METYNLNFINKEKEYNIIKQILCYNNMMSQSQTKPLQRKQNKAKYAKSQMGQVYLCW